MDILIFDDYKLAWRRQNPHDRVFPPNTVKLPYGKLVAIMLGVVAVNILSMAHTAPVIAQTIQTNYEWIKWMVGFCGVLGVEFTMFVFMYISMDSADRLGKFIRWFVILAAFLVAMIANVSSTVAAMATTGDMVELLAAIILGAFAPAANLSGGEVLRRVVDKVTLDREIARSDYHQQLLDEDRRLRNLYIRYLKSYGITDPTDIMKLSSGEKYEQPETAPASAGSGASVDVYTPPGDTTDSPTPTNSVISTPTDILTGRALDIYNDIVSSGLQAWTQQALVKRYRTSPNTIAKIRKAL